MWWERMAKRRSFLVLLLFTCLWAGLLVRLSWIQLFGTHHFSRHDVDLIKSAIKQRQQTIVLSTGRGNILDRSGESLTGREARALILFPLARGSIGENGLRQVSRIVGHTEEELLALLRTGKEPVMLRDRTGRIEPLTEEQAKAVNQLAIPGITALTVAERYRQDEVARQVIGYTHQSPELIKRNYLDEWKAGQMSLSTVVGASGLEKSFDRFLQGLEPDTLSYYVDGQGHPLRGLDMRHRQQENQFYPLSVKTTLDQPIQRRLERVADQEGLAEGAIVVLDARNADIVAMVSRPQFDPRQVDSEDHSWQNHALKQLAPGSVFKTVVAAAALAEGAVSPTERFQCDGEYGKFGFSCWKAGGHGSIAFADAFAQSCNIAFAEVAKRLGGEKIEAYAKRFGLGESVGHLTPSLFKLGPFRQLAGEEQGKLFDPGASRSDEGVIIQSAIGQRDVRMTPLQAAAMMVTILNGGRGFSPRLVSDILYRNGGSFYHFSPMPLQAEGIDTATALKMTRLMQAVVKSGTGTLLQESVWEIGGKSGTAQTEKNSAPREHQWFVGYAPVTEPQYAIAVVVENRPPGSAHAATRLFKAVVDSLASLSHTSSLAGRSGGNQRE